MLTDDRADQNRADGAVERATEPRILAAGARRKLGERRPQRASAGASGDQRKPTERQLERRVAAQG